MDLGSDQTSCHNPFNGGYYPVQLGFTEAQSLLASNPAAFKALVQERCAGPGLLRGWVWAWGTGAESGKHTRPAGAFGLGFSGLHLVLQRPGVWPWARPLISLSLCFHLCQTKWKSAELPELQGVGLWDDRGGTERASSQGLTGGPS